MAEAPTDLLIPRADVVIRDAVLGDVTYTDVRVVFVGDVVRMFDANGNVLATLADFTYEQHGDNVHVLDIGGQPGWTVTRRQGCCGG